MTTIRKWVRFLFGFSGTETNGFLILLPLLFIILFSEPVYRALRRPTSASINEADKVLLDSIAQLFERKEDKSMLQVEKKSNATRHLVMFDPNKATDATLMRIGFDEKIAKRIVNYRTKGGKFFVKSDLLKVYGMDSLFYRDLYPFINLPDVLVKKDLQQRQQNSTTTATKREENFDLNTADTVELKSVYGVGSKLARRIISYREKLGGFIRAGQVAEVYGLDSTTVKQLLRRSSVREDFLPSKINLNKATDRELSTHPYISPMIAKAIVAYRFQHGDFASVEDIRKLQNLKKEQADKIIPYLDVNP